MIRAACKKGNSGIVMGGVGRERVISGEPVRNYWGSPTHKQEEHEGGKDVTVG